MRHLMPYLLMASGIVTLAAVLWVDQGGTVVSYRLNPMGFHIGLFLISIGAVKVAGRRCGVFRDRLWLLFGSSWCCLMALEATLRLTGIMSTYADQRTGRYFTAYERNQPDEQRRWTASSTHLLQTPEYSYVRQTNRLGFSDAEFHPKQPGELLMQFYGDSYTEGDGAPKDSAYPNLLHKLLMDSAVSVQNYGTCGSDPAFSYKQIILSGLSFSPDVVVIAYNSGDYQTDFFTRGGLNRFRDGQWNSRPAPYWEFAYAYSHAFRAMCRLFHNIPPTGFLTSEPEQQGRMTRITDEWNEVFDSIAELSLQHGFRLLLVRHPMKFELEQKSYGQDFSDFDEWLRLQHPNVAHADLMPFYLDSSGNGQKEYDRLYWPIDGHHNSQGYLMMARAVRQAMVSSFPGMLTEKIIAVDTIHSE